MPLAEGSSAATISKNVAELIRAGHSQAQAAAIAYKTAGKDEAPKMAAGTLYMAPDGDVLMLRRSSKEKNYAGHWGLPGGGAEDGETPEQAAHREATEEMGSAPEWRGKKISETATPNGMVFHTFAHPVAEKFQPHLNDEHSGYAWAPLNDLPRPLHPALKSTLRSVLHGPGAGEDCAQDMTPDDWHGLVHGFLKFVSEEEREPEHQAADIGIDATHHGHVTPRFTADGHEVKARCGGVDKCSVCQDELKAKQASDAANPSGALTEAEQAEADRNHASREEMPASAFLEPGERKYPIREHKDGEWKYSRNLLLAAAREARMHGHEDLANRADKIRNGMAQDHDRFALDKDVENRTKTVDGRLIVKHSIFSAATVCPYIGKEIADWEALGLDPEKVYRLYRDPVELKKAAPTFDKIPVLLQHIPSTAEDHPADEVVGTTGEKTKFVDGDLIGSLAIWDARGIDAIESGRQKALSMGYRYQADMRPGVTPDGEPFHGRMCAIIGNHAALVTEPRVETAVVGDSNPFKTAGSSGDSTAGVKYMLVRAGKLSPMGSAARGAIIASLYPVMAADKALDLKPLLGTVRKKTWAADKARIVAGLPALIKGTGPKLATDAEVGPIVKQVEKLLDCINPEEEGMDDDPDMTSMDGEKKPWDAEDQKAYDELMARKPAEDADPEDETEEERNARMERRAADKAAADALKAGENAMDENEKPVTKAAMDAAVAKIAKDSKTEIEAVRQATIKQMRDTSEALALVDPLVGKIAIACDTADDVFKHTLKSLKIAFDGVNVAGMRVLIQRELEHKGNESTVARHTNQMAQDSGLAAEIAAFEKELGIPQRNVRAA